MINVPFSATTIIVSTVTIEFALKYIYFKLQNIENTSFLIVSMRKSYNK